MPAPYYCEFCAAKLFDSDYHVMAERLDEMKGVHNETRCCARSIKIMDEIDTNPYGEAIYSDVSTLLQYDGNGKLIFVSINYGW